MSGSDDEPVVTGVERAADQMRAATERLRDQAWMVAPMTTLQMPEQQDAFTVDH